MKFNGFYDHRRLAGQHAFLGASKYQWLNYDEEKLVNTYLKSLAVKRGTELHELAANLIRLGVKLPRNNKTLNAYVNDAIGYHMTPEQVLYYSDNCFGTADAICFKNNLLRIHDLKTGTTPASLDQLIIYAAIFCLEYGIRPGEIEFELRIYQNDEIIGCKPTAEDILPVMDKIEQYDKIINRLIEQEA